MKRNAFSFAIATLILLQLSNAQAFEMEGARGYVNPSEFSASEKLHHAIDDGRRFKKFEVALKALNIPSEPAPEFSEFPSAQDLSQESVMEHLSWLDPDGGLRRYLDLQKGSIALFKDFFSNILPTSYLEFKQDMRESGSNTDSAALIARLQAIANQVNRGDSQPLTGLRVAIDPGHMGPAELATFMEAFETEGAAKTTWDEITGKFVKVNGKKVSEGQLNLWTALLTAKELEALGAEVMLTRTKNGTVSTEDPATFNVTPYLNQYYYNSLDGWMNNYMQLSDEDLMKEIIKAPQVKSILNPSQKMQTLYITGADLEARSKMMDEFHPDLTLDIHFDANQSNVLQKSTDDVEAYVPGAFRDDETGSRNVRAMALKHLLEARRWNESVNLAGFITKSMSENLNIPLFTAPSLLSAVKVKDGVYARNLYISRRALSSLVVYLECLHYDHVNEHTQLSVLDDSTQYHGVFFTYPSRLNKISDGIRTGLLKYFRTL